MKKLSQIFSRMYLAACVLSAMFAYLLIPDQSINANRQITEIALVNPLQKVCIYCTKVMKHPDTFLDRYFSGSRSVEKCTTDSTGITGSAVCFTALFGTDKFGRDVFSRVILGIRYTFTIAISAVILSMIIGLCLGGMAGYFGGKTDQAISVMINIFWSLPTILLAFAVVMSFGRSLSSIFIAISLTMWGDVARLVRGLVMKSKEQIYVKAARTLGYTHFKILFREIIPNIMGPVWVNAAGNFALAVLLESGLSFLGFGLQPPVPTLGNILQEQYVYAITGKPMLALIPAIVVVLLILSFQLLTNHLRESLDVRQTH